MKQLTKEEVQFLLDLMKRVQIGITELNAVEVTTLAKSITEKFNDRGVK